MSNGGSRGVSDVLHSREEAHDLRHLMAKTFSTYGRLDVLANNAGPSTQSGTLESAYQRCVERNVSLFEIRIAAYDPE